MDFQLPVLEALLEKREYKQILRNILPVSVVSGIVTAIAIYTVDIIFTQLGVSISTHQNYAPAWQTLLASAYGGITEEILMRLFLMSLLIWISMKLSRQSQPSNIGVIVSIIIAAVIFGLGHLPITASLTKLDSLVITRAIVLNGIGGIVFGVLFWKKGLESAMIAHFITDVFLLTLLPLIVR